MPQGRTTWTDERLDDLARRVENGFSRVDHRFNLVDERLKHLEIRIDAQGARIDSLQRTMIQLVGATTVGILSTLATLMTVILTRA